MSTPRIKTAILGATGNVGRTYLELLHQHPNFEITYIAASDRSRGKRINGLEVGSIDAYKEADCELVFSALDTELAKQIEPRWAENRLLLSHSSAFRDDPHVPLIIPEINGDKIIGKKRGIIAKSNCTLNSFLIPLYILDRLSPLTGAVVTSFQATSGVTKGSLAPFEIIDNVIPYIHQEEEKCLREWSYFLKKPIPLSIHCNRVPVTDGHMTTVSAKFERPLSVEEAHFALSKSSIIVLKEQIDRPQPRLDRDLLGGMAISIGRIRSSSFLDLDFVSLSHNRIRGAAGGAIKTAMVAYGFTKPGL